MFFYQVYGLTLQANFPISGLEHRSDLGNADVHIDVYITDVGDSDCIPVPESAWQLHSTPHTYWTATQPEGIYFRLRYSDGEQDFVEFVLSPSGSSVWITWSARVTGGDVAALLLHVVLGCVLKLCGFTCLHANVVVVAGRAIALVGQKGAGKSTTTAALIQQGQALFSDDIAALSLSQPDKTCIVQPGYPALRLHTDTALQLYGSCEHLPTLWSQPDRWSAKRYLPLASESFPKQPLSLSAVYVLEDRNTNDRIAIEPIPAVAGFLTLAPHIYVPSITSQINRVQDFQTIGHLVQHVPLRRVHRPDDLSQISELSQTIIADLQTIYLQPIS